MNYWEELLSAIMKIYNNIIINYWTRNFDFFLKKQQFDTFFQSSLSVPSKTFMSASTTTSCPSTLVSIPTISSISVKNLFVAELLCSPYLYGSIDTCVCKSDICNANDFFTSFGKHFLPSLGQCHAWKFVVHIITYLMRFSIRVQVRAETMTFKTYNNTLRIVIVNLSFYSICDLSYSLLRIFLSTL